MRRPLLLKPAGPHLAGPRVIEGDPGYLGGNWEPGAGGARLAVGAVAV